MKRTEIRPGASIRGDVGGTGRSGITVSDASGTTRVVLGNIATEGAPDYGLKVVSSDGATVIIDGTSNVFKIQATGTTSVTVGADATGGTDVTLTGLGALSTTPAVHAHLNDTTATTDARHLGHWIEWGTATSYVALTSGGSPTQRSVYARRIFTVSTLLNGSSEAVVRLHGVNGQASSVTVYAFYHVLKEAAL